jgi:hypothetical protein
MFGGVGRALSSAAHQAFPRKPILMMILDVFRTPLIYHDVIWGMVPSLNPICLLASFCAGERSSDVFDRLGLMFRLWERTAGQSGAAGK